MSGTTIVHVERCPSVRAPPFGSLERYDSAVSTSLDRNLLAGVEDS
jgi:hypothetical protein